MYVCPEIDNFHVISFISFLFRRHKPAVWSYDLGRLKSGLP